MERTTNEKRYLLGLRLQGRLSGVAAIAVESWPKDWLASADGVDASSLYRNAATHGTTSKEALNRVTAARSASGLGADDSRMVRLRNAIESVTGEAEHAEVLPDVLPS